MENQVSSSVKTAGYHHGDLRNSLIQSAIDIIHEKGIQKLSIRDAAKRIGVSHAAPYRHFRNKKALLTAIAIAGFDKLGTSIDEARKAGSTKNEIEGQMRDFARAYIRFAMNNVEFYKIMFGDYIENKTEDADFFQAYDAPFQLMIQYVKMLHGKRADFPGIEITVLAGWSMLHGYAQFLIDNQRDHIVGSSRQIELIVDRFISVCQFQ